MKNVGVLFAGAALLALSTGCQDLKQDIPADELYLRNFIKTMGLIDPSQDWSVVKQASVTVTSSQPTDVRVLATVEGRTVLLGAWKGVQGTAELSFDCPKQVEEVFVKSSGMMAKVELGATVAVSNVAASRAGETTGSSLPGFKIDNGYFWENPYVKAMFSKLPEGKAQNINAKDIVADFSFVSTGQEFVLYPVFWETGGHDVLGVYWYENGRMHMQDIFDNDLNGDHNILYRETRGAALTASIEVAGKVGDGYPTSGTITVKFNRNVEWKGGQATLSGGTLSGPTMNGNVATFTYEGLEKDGNYTFTIPAGAVRSTDGKDWYTENKVVENSQATLTFQTVSGAKWQSASFKVDGLHVDCVINFTSAVKAGSLTATLNDGTVIEGWTLAQDGLSVSKTFEVSSYDTTYRLTPDADMVTDLDGDLLSWSEFTDSSHNYNLFQSGAKQKEYAAEPTYVDVSLTIREKDNHLLDGSGAELKQDYVIDNGGALITIKPKNDKAIVITKENITFPVSEGEARDYAFALPVCFKSKDLNKLAKYDSGNLIQHLCLIEVEPKENLLFDVLSVDEVGGSIRPRMLDIEAVSELTAVSSKVVEGDSHLYVTTTFELSANKRYVVFVIDSNATDVCQVCGFATHAEIADGEAGVSGDAGRRDVRRFFRANPAAKRQGVPGATSRATETEDFGVNGTIPSYYPDGVAAEGFTRNSRDGGKSMTDPDASRTEILTHRISFTLPKGVVFGFYLHNESGAIRITGPGEGPRDFYNYSMSSLNEEMSNSFFNRLDFDCAGSDAKYFAKGWGTVVDGKVYEKINGVDIPASRRYSTASTYTVDIDGHEMRYFSFEDWVDSDFNDIVFMVAPETGDVEIVDGEVDTMPYIFAVEDLGAMDSSDLDFNDIVFAAELVPDVNDETHNWMYVTMLAAGGELESQIYFNGVQITGGTPDQEIVSGPYKGQSKGFLHVNEWFGIDDVTTFVNVGDGEETGFTDDRLTTIRFKVDKSFSLADNENFNKGFSVKVRRYDGNETKITDITPPKAQGEAPQMIVLPCVWKWPIERIPIHDAYSGGEGAGSFTDWVEKGDGYGYQNLEWYKTPNSGSVINSPWEGSSAARDHLKGND